MKYHRDLGTAKMFFKKLMAVMKCFYLLDLLVMELSIFAPGAFVIFVEKCDWYSEI
jgi:hypothetical protein